MLMDDKTYDTVIVASRKRNNASIRNLVVGGLANLLKIIPRPPNSALNHAVTFLIDSKL
jgi:hypothetical protein